MEKSGKTIVKDAAICFSGLAKNFELCYPYIKKNLLDQTGSYDIFCCVEDDENAGKISLLNPVKIEKVKSSDVDRLMKDDLKSLKKENYKTILFPESSKFNLRNVFQQFFKVKKTLELVENHMKEKNTSYRHFIRIRFDFLPFDQIKVDDLKVRENEVVVPGFKGPRTANEVVDMFYIAKDFRTFATCCSLYDNFSKVMQQNLPIKRNLIQKLYFAFEKGYTSLFFFLFKTLNKKNRKFLQQLLGVMLLFPKMFYKKFKIQYAMNTERIFFYTLKSANKTIREEKISFVIVRNITDGLLILA